MKKLILTNILTLFITIGFGQNFIVDSTFVTDSTKIKIRGLRKKITADSSTDNRKNDSLGVYLANFGRFESYGIILKFNGKRTVKARITADYDAFDGKSSAEFEFISYTFIINNPNPKIGDTIMGRIKGKIAPIKYLYDQNSKVRFDGTFKHVIGKTYLHGVEDKRRK